MNSMQIYLKKPLLLANQIALISQHTKMSYEEMLLQKKRQQKLKESEKSFGESILIKAKLALKWA